MTEREVGARSEEERPSRSAHRLRRPLPSKPEADAALCDLCGFPMREVHCKLICDQCGYTRDCSDP